MTNGGPANHQAAGKQITHEAPPAAAISPSGQTESPPDESASHPPPTLAPDPPPMAPPVPTPEDIAPSQTPQSTLGLTRADRALLAGGGLVIGLLLVAHAIRMGGWGLSPVLIDDLPPRQYDYRLDINRASWVEWMQLDGIGEVTARRIVDERDTNGPFDSVDDLIRVRGIGPRTLEKLRPQLIDLRHNQPDNTVQAPQRQNLQHIGRNF